MYNILTLNAISEKGLCKLPKNEFAIYDELNNPHGIIVRSANMHDYECSESLLGIARAGVGINNIPVEKCSEEGVVVFNTPGANANAVKELVITGILISSRKIVEGIEWSKSLKGKENISKLVESGKKQFVGPEIKGKKLGVLGLGAIGGLVANAANALGMEVLGYDPFLTVYSAWNISSGVKLEESLDYFLSQCDYITIHIPLNDNTRNSFNSEVFSVMKKGCRLLNFSRGEIVENSALEEALSNGILDKYITDFPDENILNLENVITIPHLGASTPESEENCAEMAASQLKAFLNYGTIKNSVNLPNCEIIYSGGIRISVVHINTPDVLSSMVEYFRNNNIPIKNIINKSKNNMSYTIVDLDNISINSEEIENIIKSISGVLKVRIIREK